MSEEAKDNIPPQIPENVGKILLEPLNHAIAAGTRKALVCGVPTHAIVEMHLNQLASVMAMVEPAGARQKLVEDVIRAVAQLVTKHVDARYTTPGGVKLPGAGL